MHRAGILLALVYAAAAQRRWHIFATRTWRPSLRESRPGISDARPPRRYRVTRRFDVYYGMADNRIGVARLDLPDSLPPGEAADPQEAKV